MGLTTSDFTFIAELVRVESAIVLEPGKEYLVENRLAPLARREGSDISGLVNRLRVRRDVRLTGQVIEAMTTNETFFFRDIHPFEALATAVVPRLIEHRARFRSLRFWSAACSSGQEPYSIAMLLTERFPELSGWDVRILCTDISDEMVARTREGRYTQLEVNRGLPAALLVKHFRREGTTWTVADPLRRMLDVRPVNLASEWPPIGSFDVIFMRNVLIYFDPPMKRKLLERAARLLPPDGALFLGGAESTINLTTAFERVTAGPTAFYRPGRV